MTKLTKRQQEILTLIENHMTATGSPPTRAEIARSMGFRSPNAAEDHLRALARKGVIDLVPGTSRGIRLAQGYVGIPVLKLSSPLVLPINAENNIQGALKLDRHFFQTPMDYLLKFPKALPEFNVQEGDLLAIMQTSELQIGQLALVRHNQEINLRKFTTDMSFQNIIIEGAVLGIIRSFSKNFLES